MKSKLLKRCIVLLASTTLCLSVVGCGANNKESKTATADSKNAENTNNNASGKTYKLKLGHIMTADHPNGLGAEYFAKLVEEKTEGKVIVDVFPASQLGNEKEIFDSVDLGAIDFAILGFGDPAKKYADVGIFDAPYLAKDREHMTRILNSDVAKELYSNMQDHMNAKALCGVYFGSRYLTTKDKVVKNPDDMKGLNIRVPDQKMYIDTMSAMGAKATPMAFSEVYLALQQGVIDGEENPIAAIATNKFNQVQHYLIKTEHIIGTQALYMATKTIDMLPKEYMDKIVEAAEETRQFMNDKAFEMEDQYMQDLLKNGMELIEDVDKDAFKELTKPVYDMFSSDVIQKVESVK